MVDTINKKERVQRVSLICSNHFFPKLAIRRAIHVLGLRCRLSDKPLCDKVDVVFPLQKVSTFIHGCFWCFTDRSLALFESSLHEENYG
jgi:G:T-mismatch repair DNA endonuclease (very short patch repair protein)